MSAIKFLLDENGDPRVARAMRRQAAALEVGCIGEPGKPPLGTKDPEILLWCEANDYALVTHDRASMPLHLRDHLVAGHYVPGIFILVSPMSIGEIVEELLLVWGASDSEEYRDRLIYIHVSRWAETAMQLEDYFNFLSPDDIRIRGHRVGIESILFYYLEQGLTPEQILERLSTLDLEQIYATILYYLHNKERVGCYMKEWEEAFERAYAEQERNPPPAVARLQRLLAERPTSAR